MERELWPPLYRLVREVGADFRRKHAQHQPWVIVAVLLWAALHDRPRGWACDPANWGGTTLRPAELPSASTLSRRAHSPAMGMLLRAIEGRLRRAVGPALAAYLDGKPLPVGGCSTDRDARPKGPSGPGYKLHAIWGVGPVPIAWEVTAAGVGEPPVAERLAARAGGGGYLLADGNYDSGPLCDAAAAAGYQMVIGHWRANSGRGHRRQSAHRLRSIALRATAFGRELYALRGQIERSFGNLTSFAGGLAPLPAWVRGRRRVHAWVAAKLIINGVRIVRRKRLTA